METRSEKSAEAIVAVRRRAEREEVLEYEAMSKARRQKSASAERSGEARGEAARHPVSDEANGPRHDHESTGSGLLEAALTRENLQRAWSMVWTLPRQRRS